MLRTLSVLLRALSMCVVVGCASAPPAGQGDWVPLGQRQVSDRLDHDVIRVTARRGNFRRIKIVVMRASVDFHRVVVHFANGADQTMEMRSTIPAGGESRALDLDGNQRVIRSVEFWYDANTIRGRTAQVRLLGIR